MLKNHFILDEDLPFPKIFIYGGNRSCSLNYVDNPFVYGTSKDSIFCLHYVLFFPQEKRENLDMFVNVGCNYWYNSNERKLTYTERNYNKQKQPPRGVPRKRWSENIQQIYRRTPMPKCDFNNVALQLYWNHTSAWLFSCKSALYFQNIFSQEHFWVTASE